MKKIMAILISAGMAVSLAACSGAVPTPGSDAEPLQAEPSVAAPVAEQESSGVEVVNGADELAVYTPKEFGITTDLILEAMHEATTGYGMTGTLDLPIKVEESEIEGTAVRVRTVDIGAGVNMYLSETIEGMLTRILITASTDKATEDILEDFTFYELCVINMMDPSNSKEIMEELELANFEDAANSYTGQYVNYTYVAQSPMISYHVSPRS